MSKPRQRTAIHPATRQDGVALAISMILLVVITLLGLSAVRFTVNDLKIASNEQVRVTAAQASQSVVDATVADSGNTPVIGGIGYKSCTSSVANCDQNTVVLPNNYLAADVSGGHVTAEVERLAPLLGPPPRGIGSSLAKFSAAYFAVGAVYDKLDSGQGKSAVDQGVVVLVPTSN